MKPCLTCGKPAKELPGAAWADVLCDECFDVADKQFAPIADWLNKPEVQEAITEEDAETERQLSAGLDTLTNRN